MASSLNLLQVTNGHKAFGAQVLFEEATFAINEGEHVGVIGPNGAGKTTLFKVLINDEDLDGGQIIRSRELRVGYLSQHDRWDPEETGNSYLEKNCTIPVWEAKLKGRELQVSEEVFAKPILSLSGGYRMRIKLLGLLGRNPNLMMLDEPTNYLDLETTLLLERFLQSYEGAFLLISHDREVLRRTTDHTLEIESGEIIKYSGNIDDYFEQKEILRMQLEAQAQNQALKRKSIMDFVNRFGAKATKARQAQSKLKSLEKMEVIDLKRVPVKAVIKIPPPPHVGKSVLKLENSTFGYGTKTVLEKVSVEILRGDHVAVVGLNGAGKSTLLKGLAGTLAPLKGERVLGYQVEVAIFNQHVIEVLNPEHTVYQSLESVASRDATPQEIRNMAGSLLFSSSSIEKKVKVLSGGEKSRVALGRILLQKVPCLLLDEPTNHLDFQTVEALTQALEDYAGTLIVVSHDRGFIKRVGTKILEVATGHVFLYPGTYDEYVWSLQRSLAVDELEKPMSRAPTKEVSAPSGNTVRNLNNKEVAKQTRQLEKEIATIEKQISDLELQNSELNQKIVAGFPTAVLLNEAINTMTGNSKKLQKLEDRWLELTEKRGKP
jgi:ATP-binding cassette, subfamily F, member 3